MNELRIVSQNINGLNNCIKRKRIVQSLRKEGDIIFMQETHLNKLEHEKLGKLAAAQIFASSFGTARRGVAILIQKRVPFELEKFSKDKEGRFVFVVGKICGETMSFLNIYNPPGQDPEFMRRMMTLLTTEAKGIIIMGGDFNVAMCARDTQSKGKHKAEKTAVLLKRMGKELGLLDVWRHLYPQEKKFTFYSEAHRIYSRLDYFFMFKEDINKIKKCDIKPIVLGDHAPITLSLMIANEKVRTIWRLNNSLLQDKQFKDKIKQIIETYFQENDKDDVSPVTLWEAAKATIRGEIISFASWKKQRYMKENNKINDEIKKLQREHEETRDEKVKERLIDKQNKLKELCTEEIEKSLAFSRQQFYDNSPKALKMLAFKLKKQKQRAVISKIEGNDLKYTVNPDKLIVLKKIDETDYVKNFEYKIIRF